MGCHSLPLTVGTNSNVVGGFDAPSARGMWDRSTLFSNGIFSSQEVLQGAQDCANGIEPPTEDLRHSILGSGRRIPVDDLGDPCDLRSPEIELFLLPARSAAVPDPRDDLGSRRRHDRARLASSPPSRALFALVYGVRGDAIWQFQLEFGTGLPGLTGRQVSIDPANPDDPETVVASST